MQFFNTLISAFLLTAAAVAQSDVTVHVVQVGANGTLTFSPDTLTANPGEVVQFHFMAKNHSVVQSAFSSPCAPINTVMSNVTGFKSGFMPVTNTIPVFSIMVNDTKPIWAYCSQTMHCAKGMVMAINAPTSGNKTFDAFKALAMSSANSTSSTGSSSTSSSSGSSSSDSGSSTSSGSAASSSSAVPKAGDGSKPMVNMALLMLVGVFGLFFAGL